MSLTWSTITDPEDAPPTPGVYAYLKFRSIIYLGKSVNLRARLKSHAQSARHDPHERAIQAEHTAIKYTLADSDFLATLLEAKLIQQYLPRYNRVLRDNKSYLYIVINLGDAYPKPRLFRGRDLTSHTSSKIHNTKYKLFGPFQTRKVADDILHTIRRLIPYCQQNRVGGRACFYHKLGLCDPCPSAITTDKERLRYRRQLRQIVRILSGNLSPVIKKLEKELKQASGKQDYETALKLRDRLHKFESALSRYSLTDGRVNSYSQADQSLDELSSILGVRPLSRIEAYDASTFQLAHSVVSLVVATHGQLDKSQYRRFRLNNPRHRSDFTMLKEALDRRLRHKQWPQPDLLLIDGGRPQLKQLQPLLDQLASPPLMLGLAKRPDRLVLLPDTTISLPADSPALQLLARLRNEAHRFANTYRKLLEKQAKQL